MHEEKTVEFNDWYIIDTPKTLDEVYGQDTIVNHFKNKQRDQKFDKSTMLVGQYGSGKTVLAKILAKSIACKNTNDKGEPCDNCPTCNAVNNETYNRDVVYMNGTNMSAADVDKILNNCFVTPATKDRAKVFICDETQGFSPAAIERFLIETASPKKGFFFIFTAMSKLQGKNPGALQSRCKQWKMKIPQAEEIYPFLGSIVLKKKLQLPKEFLTEGLQFISENCNLSYRQALQMLQQCVEGEIFTVEKIKETFDVVSYDDACKILTHLSHGVRDKLVFETVTGQDYQEKLPLLLMVMGNAAAYAAFGDAYIDSHEKWKWKQPAEIANGPHFQKLCDTFDNLATKAYIKRGEWLMALSRFLLEVNEKAPAGVSKLDSGRPSVAEEPKKVVRRKTM